MLRDIRSGQDTQVAAVVRVIAAIEPDVLALQGIDWDYEGRGLGALVDRLAEAGVHYPHQFTARPNSGLASGVDLDGDGRSEDATDAHGFGEFTGQKGIAVLSQLPIDAARVQNFSDLLWRDVPGASLPVHADGRPFPSSEAQAVQRLSNTAHWVVPIRLKSGRELRLLTFQASPPVFDGPEDRNGLRNADEIAFWSRYLNGDLGPAPETGFVIAGGANLDPSDSDGRREAIRDLLTYSRIQDPEPSSQGGAQAGDQGHDGPDALDTVDWPRVGRLRVDYVLPSRDWQVDKAGVHWPGVGEPGHEDVLAASRHRLVWVDLVID